MSESDVTERPPSEPQMPEASSPIPDGPFLVRATPRSMLRLAIGSAATISSLLCLIDAIGLIPDLQQKGFLVWAVRVSGLWVQCYILWTIGFLSMLYAVRWAAGGIELHPDGFRLWRFGKFVRWDAVRALACEPQPFFSKAFCLRPLAHRLTIYSAKETKAGAPPKIVGQNIPSFQVDSEDFQSILVYVSERCFNLRPSSASVLITQDSVRSALRKSYTDGRMTRVVISCVILLSLVTFLGRRSIVNYSLNSGNREFRQEHYERAIDHYRRATKFDPTFAIAWDRLARSEYRLNRVDEAQQDWEMALRMKPDFVESKIGLAGLHIRKRRWKEAEGLLQRAQMLSPTNVAVFMSFGDLYIRQHRYEQAIDILTRVAQHDEANTRARALLARAYLRNGNVSAAEQQLQMHDLDHNLSLLDRAFIDLVTAELLIAKGDLKKAEQKLEFLTRKVGASAMTNEDLLLDWISLRAKQQDEVALASLLERAKKQNIPDAEVARARGLVEKAPT